MPKAKPSTKIYISSNTDWFDAKIEIHFGEQKVTVDEPDTESAISILRGIKEKYENHHKVQIKDDAIIARIDYRITCSIHLPYDEGWVATNGRLN